MIEVTSTRANALIDPALHIWHYEIPLYLFLGGLVAGVMVLSGSWLLARPSVQERSRTLALLPWSAPLLLSAGMLFLWLDLENRWNVFRFYFTFEPASPMSWGSWILLAIYPVSMLTALASHPIARISHWKHYDAVMQHTRAIAIASVIGGAALGIYTGVLLGTMAARPLWNSALLGPLFLASGVSSGAAFLLLFRLKIDERIRIARFDAAVIAIELLLLALWLIGLMSGGAASRAAASQLLGGSYTAAFWTLVIALGLLTPLVVEWLEHRRHETPGRVAAVLVLLGGFSLRWIVVFAGQL